MAILSACRAFRDSVRELECVLRLQSPGAYYAPTVPPWLARSLSESEMSQTYDIDVSICTCGCAIKTATCLTEERGPKPGDLTVCIKCETILRFDENLKLHVVTDEEFSLMSPRVQGDIEHFREIIHEVRKMN